MNRKHTTLLAWYTRFPFPKQAAPLYFLVMRIGSHPNLCDKYERNVVLVVSSGSSKVPALNASMILSVYWISSSCCYTVRCYFLMIDIMLMIVMDKDQTLTNKDEKQKFLWLTVHLPRRSPFSFFSVGGKVNGNDCCWCWNWDVHCWKISNVCCMFGKVGKPLLDVKL